MQDKQIPCPEKKRQRCCAQTKKEPGQLHAWLANMRWGKPSGAPLLAEGSQPPDHSVLSSACPAYNCR